MLDRVSGRDNSLQWSTGVTVSTLVGLAAGSWMVYRRLTRPKPKLPYPPGPPGHWLMGNALSLPNVTKGEHLDLKLLEWSREYGRIFTIRVPLLGRLIVVADPDAAKHILITKNYPKSWTYKSNAPILGERSIVTSEGDDWFSKRRAFNPGFSPNFLKDMVSVMTDKMQRFLNCVDDDIVQKKETNMLERAQTFTSDVIVGIAFGEDWGGSSPHPAREWETELTELLSGPKSSPLVKLFGFHVQRRINHFQALLDAEMFAIIDRRLDEQSSSHQSKSRTDICSIAIDQLKQPDGTLTEDDKITVMHQLKTFYFAGHDTTATTIAWTIWLLSQHDDVLTKVRNELVDQGVDVAAPTYNQLQKCSYLDAVIKETLRLYPPAGMARYTSDVTETYGSYTLGGAVLYVSPYVLHRQESVWGENANDFVPERFLENESVAAKFVAFSRGSRDCLGKYFAMLEAKIAVIALVSRYDVECVDPFDYVCYKITSCPRGGAKVRFSLRD